LAAGRAVAMSARRFKPYSAYKDSGVEWLGEVPTHWDVRKVKRLCLVRRGSSPRPIDDPIYFDDDGEYAWVRIADVTASERYLERTTQRLSALGKSKSVALEPGELFVSIAATVGKPIITKIKCCIHDGFVYFVGLHENREFLFYLFSCGEPYKGLGKLGTQLNLNTDTIGDIYLPRPCSAEQESIVQFLDRETAKIDALVAKKERLIELLQEQRTALITRAVTKGLDPNVPMKDSGVEWLGEIPAHWTAKHVGQVCSRVTDGAHISPDTSSADFPFVSTVDIRDGAIDFDGCLRTSQSSYEYMERTECRPKDGDVLFSKDGTVGTTAVVTTHRAFVVASSLVILSPDKNEVDARWLNYWLNGVFIKDQVGLLLSGAALRRISVAKVGRLPVLLPRKLDEQRDIVSFLDHETARIDALVSKVRDAIDRLNELSTALISAAVTGKIDVRGASGEASAAQGGVA
jgi:type I restriction enzyme S subunit